MRALPLVVILAGCGAGHDFVSPTTQQGPPPFLGISGPTPPAPPEAISAGPPLPAPTAHPISFFRTQDANAWIRHNFQIQAAYSRVLAVSADGKAPAKLTVGKLDLEGPPGAEPTVEVAVDRTFPTIDEAAREAKGGDLVAVLPGRYAGFTLGDKPDAGDQRYIHVKALGAPGDVIIDAPCPDDPHWMVNLAGAHHVIVQGFRIRGVASPGDAKPKGPYAGIFLNGDFLRTSALAHHVAIVGNFSSNHAKWGFHSVDSHTVLLQDNVFAFSAREHGAYVSDGSDDYVIRRNVFFGNNASGLQVNVDPQASLDKLSRHPALEHPPLVPTRESALAILNAATLRFGANAFPDGRGFNYIIEANVANGNGRVGGAAVNLAGVRESLIQNNLVYDNQSSGIAEWDNGNPWDAALVKPGPQSAGEVTGADVLPIFGCFNNVIRSNTVLMAVRSRPALTAGHGSWGTRAYNNVIINDDSASIEVDNTSIWRFDGSRNVLDRVNYEGSASWLKTLALSLPDGAHSSTGVKRSVLATSFVRASDEPWILIDARWWRPNPARPDFHPRAVGGLLAGRGDARHLPPADLDGKPRGKPDIGAYAAP